MFNAEIKFKKISDTSRLAIVEGKLTKISDVSVKYDFANECAIYSFSTPDGLRVRETDPNFFDSEEDFRTGKQNVEYVELYKILETNGVKYDWNGKFEIGSPLKPYVWKFEGGQPVKKYIKSIVIKDGKPQIEDDEYLSRKECLEDNDYIFVDSDGVEHVRKSLKKHILLNDKQKEIVNRLKSVMKEAEDANIAIAYLAEYGCMATFNCEDITTDYFRGERDDSAIDSRYLYDNYFFTNSEWTMGYDDFLKLKD